MNVNRVGKTETYGATRPTHHRETASGATVDCHQGGVEAQPKWMKLAGALALAGMLTTGCGQNPQNAPAAPATPASAPAAPVKPASLANACYEFEQLAKTKDLSNPTELATVQAAQIKCNARKQEAQRTADQVKVAVGATAVAAVGAVAFLAIMFGADPKDLMK